MKGLFKGFKYLTNIFSEEKEEEIEIGYPTDVKHVAHIGSDAPSATTPSWMSEFKSPPEILNNSPANNVDDRQSEPSKEGSSRKRRSKRVPSNGTTLDSPARKSDAPRPARRKPSAGSESPLGSPRETPKQSRRHRSSNGSMDADSGSTSSRTSRKAKNSDHEQSAEDQPPIPKHAGKRKSKGGSKAKLSKELDSPRAISVPNDEARSELTYYL